MTMFVRRTGAIAFITALIAFGCVSGIAVTAGPATVQSPQSPAEAPVSLPNQKGSLKFTVLGDFGTGGRGEYELAARMAQFREGFHFDIVILVGDNLYGSERPQDFKVKF